MAKRRRLSPTPEAVSKEGDPMNPLNPLGIAQPPRRPPVADVAADAATSAAIDKLADELTAARQEGRMVVKLPLTAIKSDHLTRDRLYHDDEELRALKDSLQARGQQTPVEVVELGQGQYGLISGARRLLALQSIYTDTNSESFSQIQCLIRAPETAEDAYLAMVEENEIRADISFYERGRLVAEAVEMGIFANVKEAVKGLFGNATPARRSKILTFVTLHVALGKTLLYPAQIPEKLGLPLVQLLKADPAAAKRLRKALGAKPDRTATEERKTLERALVPGTARPVDQGTDIAPGIKLLRKKGQVVLHGPGVNDGFVAALSAFLSNS